MSQVRSARAAKTMSTDALIAYAQAAARRAQQENVKSAGQARESAHDANIRMRVEAAELDFQRAGLETNGERKKSDRTMLGWAGGALLCGAVLAVGFAVGLGPLAMVALAGIAAVAFGGGGATGAALGERASAEAKDAASVAQKAASGLQIGAARADKQQQVEKDRETEARELYKQELQIARELLQARKEQFNATRSR